ncbi:hypothetical protein PP459_gp016 [Streptomyces phage Wakanda]|uniref:Uncharacterized protein n=2 Tax=Wakandavirus TaxID=3044854 RepID=A0A6G8R3M8_9CAUD|nr:hypothetical protein PP459_gp016 [Streptomyces phage Wakanda]YP_010652539.1 hypothetical protein PP460_gp019 [Streptomyces phage Muntaha]QIN94217.1 hypothetical protein SEA_WAKANDA_257 [Streptomyces phage Wakanda]QIN94783.1 hypothetical protein SEA_MUNTAHA_260 [Streptomyces phage Muntaha]
METLAEFAARLEMEQARRDYRATWSSLDRHAESSAWEYTNACYRAWAVLTNR